MKIVNNFGGINKEIYNIGDILHKVGKNYLRALPIVCNENGEDFEDYRIYGNTGGVGDRTVNLWDGTYDALNKYLDDSGSEVGNSDWRISKYISVNDENYTLNNIMGGAPCACFYDINYDFISSIRYNALTKKNLLLQTPSNAAYIKISVPRIGIYTDSDKVSLTPGTIPIPYGYEVDMSVKSGNLFDGEYPNIETSPTIIKYRPLYVGNGLFTLSTTTPAHGEGNYTELFFLAGDVSSGASSAGNGVYDGHPKTIESVDGYVTIAYRMEIDDPREYETELIKTATTPIYIGSSPLGEDEYIDYDSGKIYRMSGGTLTPTDPPAPLPSIPTLNGKTTVSYAGTGTAPEKAWFSGMEFEIEDVYFGDKHIFSVWGEYDGMLPAQFNANGENLVQYRVYGNTGGVGDRTENICTALIAGSYESTGYETTYAHMACTTQPILLDEGKITISVSTGAIYLKKIENGVSVQTIVAGAVSPATITISDSGTYAIQINAPITAETLKEINDTIVAVKGSTAPTEYIPYGYEAPMSESDGTTTTTTPIYIGSDPLGEDEYVDYGEGKIYRRKTNLVDGYFDKSTIGTTGVIQYSANTNVYSFPIEAGKEYICINNEDLVYALYTTQPEKGAQAYDQQRYFARTGRYIFTAPFTGWFATRAQQNSTATYAAETPYLQPVVPPVPLPALPTVDGTTITDYAGQSAAPTKFYAKYRKQNF